MKTTEEKKNTETAKKPVAAKTPVAAKASVEAAAPVAVKKKQKRTSPQCNVYVNASFNNTIVSITDPDGNLLSCSTPGMVGFKGSRKSTAYAATRAAQDAVEKAQKYGVKEAKVYIKGPGPGRNAAVKGLDSAGLRVSFLSDLTSVPHNGCRPRKKPRK